MKQKTALEILKTGQNLFITGQAGTGKTYLLNQYIDFLNQHAVDVSVVAPTGIAASHLDGSTIHSFFGLGLRNNVDDYYIDNLLQKKYLHKRFKNLKVLLIDEISMVSPELLDSMNKITKAFKFSDKPFGGVQVIISGDFFQLPPIIKDKSIKKKFAWQSDVWKELDLKTCYLEEKFRQKDNKIIQILEQIREGKVDQENIDFLNSTRKNTFEFEPTKLYTHNIDIDRINQKKLEELQEKTQIFEAKTLGAKKNVQKIFASSMIVETLVLKKEAVVLFIKNDPQGKYVNGNLGKIIGFTKQNLPIVKTLEGKRIEVEQQSFVLKNQDNKEIAEVKQIPLKLAWAITVHKSQGMTLDGAEIDLSKTFEIGQGYVALSRVKDTKGLKVLGMNQKALEVDKLTLFIDSKIKEASLKTQKEFDQKTKEEIENEKRKFFEKIDAVFDKENVEKVTKEVKQKVQKIKKAKKEKEKKEKKTTYQKTAELIYKVQSLNELVEERGFSYDTILKHLEQLLKDNQIKIKDLKKFKPQKEIFSKVQKAYKEIKKENKKEDFLESGKIKLRSIFEKLNEEVSYDDIKLSRIFLD
ncbi:helicase [Candidatus Campbellbacteria bacterium]|nr:MAG: helicase [Candidatus Campbellbacteria bacterium]